MTEIILDIRIRHDYMVLQETPFKNKRQRLKVKKKTQKTK